MRSYLVPLLVTGAFATSAFTLTSDVPGRKEAQRIRAHFDSVLVELPARDLAALTVQQRARRTSLLETLRIYRDRGAFPKNYDFPGQAVPYFVDRKTGILCAVAHLLESTARRDIVDRVAATDNNVWVAQLASDTAFTGWLDASGLTLDEAARIQVPYTESSSALNAYSLASIGTATVSLGTTIWNATTNRDAKVPFVNALGLVSGMSSIALGIGATRQDDVPQGFAIANFGVGTVSMLVATSSIMRRQHLSAMRRAAEHQRHAAAEQSGIETTVTPTFSASQKVAGLLVQVRF
jgi:hypothetical protein